MTDIAIQTPFREKKFVELSKGTGLNLFRKQILPARSINYKGRTITFDKAFLDGVKQSFLDKAFDQVPFQLAGSDNAHTVDPERFRGEIKALQVTEDGLDAIVQLTNAGAEVVRNNPRLGVSCRVHQEYERESDKKHFGPTIEHVLGTLNPHENGMKPWEPIALANENTEVIDLSAETYEPKKGATMPEDKTKLTAERRAELDKQFAEQAEYAAELAALAPAADPAKAAADAAAAAAKVDGTGKTQVEIDAELDAFLEEALKDPAAASLSNDATGIDLVNAQLASQRSALDETRAELDLARFEKEKGELLLEGIPPAMVDLAMPLLLGKDHTIDLSNGTSVDAGEVVRKILAECKGIVDLSKETVPAPGSPASDKTGTMLDSWEKQYPSVISKTAAKS